MVFGTVVVVRSVPVVGVEGFVMVHYPGRRLLIGVLVFAAVALGACGGDRASDSSADSSEATTSTSAAPSSSAGPDDTAEVVDMSDTSACLTGTWDLLADQIAGIFDQGMLASIPDLDVSVEGGGRVELRGDGTYSYTPAYSVVLTAADATGTGEWSGSQQGTWSVEGTTLTLSETSNDITGSVTVFGSAFPLGPPMSFGGDTEVVSCDPATFTISTSSPAGPIEHTLVFAG